jgi:hypothetical protein
MAAHAADVGAIAALEAALASSAVHGRRAAAAALGALASARSRPALERARAEDPDPEVRRVAEDALRA